MKGKSLFKKIGAIATTAAMLASVGVTGFAADPKPAGDNDNKGIIVKTPVVTEWDLTTNQAAAGTGVYQVAVSYGTDTDVINGIGVTMLAYGMKDGSSLDNDDIPDGYDAGTPADGDAPAVESTMRIVGVDQINTADVKDDPNTTEVESIATGTFTFYVDTNESSTNAQIKMKKGQTGIVLLSGDGADGANGVLFSIPKATGVYNGVAGSIDTVQINSWSTNKDDDIEAAAIAALGTPGVYAKVAASADSDSCEEIGITTSFAKAHTTELIGDATNGYKLKITLKSAVETYTYSLAAGTEIVVTIENVVEEALVAASIEQINPITVAATQLDNYQGTSEDKLRTAIKAAIEAASITFKDAENNSVTIPSGVEVAVDDVTAPTSEDAETDPTYGLKIGDYTAKFTVEMGDYASNGAKVSVGSAIEGNTVTVTYTAEDNRTVIGGAKLADGATTLTITKADAPANKTELNTMVAQLIAAKGVVVVKKDEASTTAATTAYSVASEDSYTGAPTDTDVTLTYTVTVTATDLSSEWKFETGTSVTFDITVTVQKNAPAYACGDVNHDTYVDAFDATLILRYDVNHDDEKYSYVGTRTYEADVNADTYIDAFDATIIERHDAGINGYETLPWSK